MYIYIYIYQVKKHSSAPSWFAPTPCFATSHPPRTHNVGWPRSQPATTTLEVSGIWGLARTCNCRKKHQGGPKEKVWVGQGGARKFKRAPTGPKVKIRKHQDDPQRGPERKLAKNVVRYALLKGSWRGPWEAKVRIALLC